MYNADGSRGECAAMLFAASRASMTTLGRAQKSLVIDTRLRPEDHHN